MARDLIDRQALVEHYDSEEFEGKFVWSKSIIKYIQSLPAGGRSQVIVDIRVKLK